MISQDKKDILANLKRAENYIEASKQVCEIPGHIKEDLDEIFLKIIRVRRIVNYL